VFLYNLFVEQANFLFLFRDEYILILYLPTMYVYCFILQPRACKKQDVLIHTKKHKHWTSRLNYLLNIDSLDRVREVYIYITLGSTPDMCYFNCLVDVFKDVYVYLYMCSINNNNTANIVSVDLISFSDLICLLSHSFSWF
jgi:hypothetical protein